MHPLCASLADTSYYIVDGGICPRTDLVALRDSDVTCTCERCQPVHCLFLNERFICDLSLCRSALRIKWSPEFCMDPLCKGVKKMAWYPQAQPLIMAAGRKYLQGSGAEAEMPHLFGNHVIGSTHLFAMAWIDKSAWYILQPPRRRRKGDTQTLLTS